MPDRRQLRALLRTSGMQERSQQEPGIPFGWQMGT